MIHTSLRVAIAICALAPAIAAAQIQIPMINLGLAGSAFNPGGPTSEVDWFTTAIAATNFANYSLTLPAATISVLVLDPIAVPEPTTVALLLFASAATPLRRRT